MKKLRKNTNIAANSIKAYASNCACVVYGCNLSQDYGMRVNTVGAA